MNQMVRLIVGSVGVRSLFLNFCYYAISPTGVCKAEGTVKFKNKDLTPYSSR